MTVGRRHLFLALSFLCLSVTLTSGLVRAQGPGTHKMGGSPPHAVWGTDLTPDQLKDALARLGQGDGSPEMSQLQELFKDFLLKQDPKLDLNNPQVQQALKNIVGNKDLMDKLQAFAKEKQGERGLPRFSQEDIDKLLKSQIHDGGLNTPTVPSPKTQPPNIPPPNLPNLPPNLKFPPNPKQGGNTDGAVNPMPMGGQADFPNPIDPGNPLNMGKGNPLLPNNNPFGQPDEPTDPRSKSMAALAALWERNVGPLDETPEVKRTLFDLASGENGFDFDMKDDKGNSIWDLIKNSSGDNPTLSDTLNGDGGDWKMPKFDLPTVGWSDWFGNSRSSPIGESSASLPKPRIDPSSASGSGSGGFGGFGSFGGSWLPVVLLGLVIMGGLLLWWWYLRDPDTAASGFVGNGLGPWPVDPQAINTREDVVKAFEYLSVLICGPAAKMWTHGTIAEALTDLAISHGETAVKLARLYELARYAPLDEPLTRHEVIKARHLICDLAGVS